MVVPAECVGYIPFHCFLARIFLLPGFLRNARITTAFNCWQEKYEEAAPLIMRAITIGEKTLPPDHPDLVVRLSSMGDLLQNQVGAVNTFTETFCGVPLLL